MTSLDLDAYWPPVDPDDMRAAEGGDMRNLVGSSTTLQDTTWRASTAFTWGGTTWRSVVQPQIGPDRWSLGRTCGHKHRSAEAALECGENRLSRKVDRWLRGIR